MLRLGGNIYYTFKLAIVDGLTMQDVGGAMSGMSGDGLDIALVKIGAEGGGLRADLLAFHTAPYDETLSARIRGAGC